MSTQTLSTPFADELRAWRRARRLSQLELSLNAGVSQRHISFLESGKSAPSREMVALLASTLQLPSQSRDAFFVAAGFAPARRAKGIDDPILAPAREAMDFILERSEPYPSMALSRDWRIMAANSAMQRLSGWMIAGDPKADVPLTDIDYMDMLSDPNGLRAMIVQGEEITVALLDVMIQDATAAREIERLQHLRKLRARFPAYAPALGPLPLLELARDGWSLKFITILTSFAPPTDPSLEGMKLELFFPADAATRTMLEAWAKTQ
jgi:transcriptional regulator with XRE-family HTH domain